MNPLDYYCPVCKAQPGEYCVATRGESEGTSYGKSYYHKSRTTSNRSTPRYSQEMVTTVVTSLSESVSNLELENKVLKSKLTRMAAILNEIEEV